MRFFEGFGLLGLVLPAICWFVCSHLFGATMGHLSAGAAGLVLGALLVWLIATRLARSLRSTIDPRTGNTIVFSPKHKVLFLPMQYAGALFAIAGVVSLVVRRHGMF